MKMNTTGMTLKSTTSTTITKKTIIAINLERKVIRRKVMVARGTMEAMVIRTVVSDMESPSADTVAVSVMADTVMGDMVLVDTEADTDMAGTVAVMAMEVGMVDTEGMEGTVTEERSTPFTRPSTPSTTTFTRPTHLARRTSKLASTT